MQKHSLPWTNDDEFNIMASLLAKKNKCPRVITLLNNSTYDQMTTQLGLDVVINPRTITVSEILQHIRRGRIKRVYTIHEALGEIIEADVMHNSGLCDMAIKDLSLPKGAKVCCIVREGEAIFPRSNTIIKENDRVVTYTPQKGVKKLEKILARVI